jgi:glycosyltransferase involved in cell wall biosynthesis
VPSPRGERSFPRVNKTLHIAWSLDGGGAERAVYQLVREQRRTGRIADVAVASSTGIYGDLLLQEGTSVFVLGQNDAFDRRPKRQALEIFTSYPILHFHCVEPLLFAWAASVTTSCKIYSHRAGLFAYPLRRRLRYGIGGYFVRRSFDALSANTTQAAHAAAQLFGISVDVVEVIYNGIDFSLLRPRRSAADVLGEIGVEDKSTLLVGTTAHIRPFKRIDRLVRAVADLQSLPICLLIVGDGPGRPELERLAMQLGIRDRVRFIDKTDHIGDYLQLLDVFSLPSGREESFGNSAVEAMGVGVPTVVFSDGGGLVEHVEHGVTGLIARDYADYVHHLRRLIEDPVLRASLGESARHSTRKRYAVARMVRQYDALYTQASAREDRGLAS